MSSTCTSMLGHRQNVLLVATLLAACGLIALIPRQSQELVASEAIATTVRAPLTVPQVNSNVVLPKDQLTQKEDYEVPLKEADLEKDLEEMGNVLGTVATAAYPFLAAVMALVAGFVLGKAAPAVFSGRQSSQGNDLRPMEMAATEETPLSRRGILAALSTLPVAAAVNPAFAARSAGRVGGGAFRSRAAPPPPAAAPRPQVNNTTVFVAPPQPSFGFGVAPAVPFGYGYGYGVGFSAGELLALSAIELASAYAREQRRQEYLRQQLEVQRQLGRDQAQIEDLQRQLAAQEQRMNELQNVMGQRGVAVPAQ